MVKVANPWNWVRCDQCEYGLKDAQTGLPHLKPTGFLTASPGLKKSLSKRCSGYHQHQPLEGWPEDQESTTMADITLQGHFG